MRVLSLIPPMTQLNTPYPSTAYLTGFLRSRGVKAFQSDLALSLVLRLFSSAGLSEIRSDLSQSEKSQRSAAVVSFLDQFDRYAATIDSVISFLQDTDSTLAYRISGRAFLPEGPRFQSLETYDDSDGDGLGWAFGSLGLHDRARHLATLYLNDIADALRSGVDSRFEFVRYAESLAMSQPTFDPLASALAEPPNLVDRTLLQLAREAVNHYQPRLVLLSVPFPGSVYGAFRIAREIRSMDPEIQIVLGGGYVNTELRELSEPRVFDDFDYVTLDDGERPTLALLDFMSGGRGREKLVRTFYRDESGRVVYANSGEADIPYAETGTPTWDGLPIHKYLSLFDMLNPMHRLWSDGRWNKLTVAHGCYWKKCSFCDVSLDYISRYDEAAAGTLVDRIESIVKETGQTGFHFVDEAAPPKSLRALADELIRRRRTISWWGNIRFEKSFTSELCGRLAESGCIAVSGGLEVASDRLLRLMKKGVTVEQVARVTHAFSQAGILVHAYLMYGFPTQTIQDTVDSLEYVRQLFAAGCIQSGFFHRFSCTVHSPVGKNPEEYGITLEPLPAVTFAKNDIRFHDPTGVDHGSLGAALTKAIYNYMHGIGLEDDVRVWFAEQMPKKKIPNSTVPAAFIERALAKKI